MRATLTTICIVLGICVFVAGCNDSSAKLPTWGAQDQVAAESDYEYDYDYNEENYYGCEEEYYTDGEYYGGESYGSESYSDYSQVEYVAYEPCEHGYWYPHEECIGLGD